MLKRICVYMDKQQLKLLERIGKKKGLKLAQMIRLAISEYLAHQETQEGHVARIKNHLSRP
jgi:hypothetical protein